MRGRTWLGFRAALVVTFVSLAWAPVAAVAHTPLVSSTPGSGTRIAEPPTHVVLEFREPVSLEEGSVTVAAPGGTDRVEGVLVSANGLVVSAVLGGQGQQGSWVVGYRVRGSDGHLVSGRLGFTVGVGPSTTAVPSLQPGAAIPLLLVVAVLAFVALVPRQRRGEGMSR